MTESIKNHLKRRAVVIAERVELELTVAGTEYAPLERAVFKSTKNNTKAPKEKHITFLVREIADGEAQSKTVLKMLARRLKEVGSSSVNAASLAAGLKTLAVWHRCLNAGNASFLSLCATYAHVVEPPSSNPMGLLYGSYLREVLASYHDIKHAYHRESDFDASHIDTLKPADLMAHAPRILAQVRTPFFAAGSREREREPMVASGSGVARGCRRAARDGVRMNVRGACTNARRCGQLVKLCECEIQGGLIDTKTRAAVRKRPFSPHPYTLHPKH